MSTSYKTKYMHFTVHCTSTSMLVSGIKCSGHWQNMIDTDESHFSFAIYSVDPLEFASNLQQFLNNREDTKKYRVYDYVELKTGAPHDTIRMSRACTNFGVTRGNLKVLYRGSIDSLHGLPEAIEREYRRYLEKSEKEAQEWAKE